VKDQTTPAMNYFSCPQQAVLLCPEDQGFEKNCVTLPAMQRASQKTDDHQDQFCECHKISP
jgi:hypothetical protein